jgi:hypothetical protein
MALPALTPDMPAVVVFGPRGIIVRGSLKTCAEVLKSRIGETVSEAAALRDYISVAV